MKPNVPKEHSSTNAFAVADYQLHLQHLMVLCNWCRSKQSRHHREGALVGLVSPNKTRSLRMEIWSTTQISGVFDKICNVKPSL